MNAHPNAKPVLSLHNVTHAYGNGPGRVTALYDVSLDVFPGEMIIVCGPSGSGKTTLLNLLGLLDRPTIGDVILENRQCTSLNEDERAVVRNQAVGFVFQQFHLLPTMTVMENVLVPLWLSEHPARVRGDKQWRADRVRIHHQARDLLIDVGLADKLQRYPSELSVGQQQRVAIVRALVNDPRLIIADEPTSSLDSHSADEIVALLIRLNREGKTLIIATHNDKLSSLGDQIIRLSNGRIVGSV